MLFYGNMAVLFAALPAIRQQGKGGLMHIVSMLSQKGGTGKTTIAKRVAEKLGIT